MPNLVFVWLGNELPSWAKISLSMCSRFNSCKIVLLCNKSLGTVRGNFTQIYIEDFYQQPEFICKWYASKVNSFRDGFWIKTSERFFILEQYMLAFHINKIFHAEIDNLIFNISGLANNLDLLQSGIFCPRDADNRGIASFIYINNVESLKILRRYYETNYLESINDMKFMGKLLNNQKNYFHSLPTDNSLPVDNRRWGTLDPSLTGGIFDAASIGQYLLGIDIRNSYYPTFNGFVNENASRYINEFDFLIDKQNSNLYISENINHPRIKVYNLHIHSKNFYIIKNVGLEKIILRLKQGQKTFVGWKPPFFKRKVFYNQFLF